MSCAVTPERGAKRKWRSTSISMIWRTERWQKGHSPSKKTRCSCIGFHSNQYLGPLSLELIEALGKSQDFLLTALATVDLKLDLLSLQHPMPFEDFLDRLDETRDGSFAIDFLL